MVAISECGDCTRIEKPILDSYFLQNCDKGVISKSGFGQLAALNQEKSHKDSHVLGTIDVSLIQIGYKE
jgi:hypothetical protein